MSKIFGTNVSNNSVNEAVVYNKGISPLKCPVVWTYGPGSHQDTFQKKWSTQGNICVMTCYYQSQPAVRGYRQRLHAFWKEKELLEAGEQRLFDQARFDSKGRLIWELVASGENNVEVQKE